MAAVLTSGELARPLRYYTSVFGITNDLTELIFFFPPCLRSFEEIGLSTSTKIKTKTKGGCVCGCVWVVATEICVHLKL